MKFRRRRSIVLIAVLAALLIGIALFAYLQRNNLQAFLMSMQYSEDELAALQEKSLSDLMEKYGLEPMPPVSDDAASAAEEPSDTEHVTPTEPTAPLPKPEEILNIAPGLIPEAINPSVGKQEKQEKPTQQTQLPPQAQPQQQQTQDRPEALPKDVQNLVYSLYTLQSQFVGKLEGLAASTRAQFDALPDEKRIGTTRASMVKATLSQAISLESQCDGRVAAILRELRSTLKKHGLDGTIADNAENYYATQKGLIKAEYMRKYNKYLK